MNKLTWYTIILCAILAQVPYLHEFLYEGSKLHIKQILLFKNPVFDVIMRVLSFLGDGDTCYLYCVGVWAMGRNTKNRSSYYESMFLSVTLSISASVNYLLKSLFHKSRPLFDDITLADTTMKDCAAEFGNPSGHSLMSTSVYLSILQIHFDYNREFYHQNRLKRVMLNLGTYSLLLGIIYSRVYCGRHTFDQCLNGFFVGYWIYHFLYYFWRPFFFNEDIKPESRHFRQFLLAFMIVCAFVSSAFGVYYYIENFVDIPVHWIDNAKQICPKLRDSYMLHYNTVSGIGVSGFILSFYAFKAYRWQTGDPLVFSYQEAEGENERNPVLEVIVRLVSCLALDIFTNEFLIKFMFGPKVNMWQDFLVKRFGLTTVLCILINSKYFDNAMRYMFRRPNKS